MTGGKEEEREEERERKRGKRAGGGEMESEKKPDRRERGSARGRGKGRECTKKDGEVRLEGEPQYSFVLRCCPFRLVLKCEITTVRLLGWVF